MSTNRILCKYFKRGACKDNNCLFSHDRNDPSNNVCTYYRKGRCSYGSRCRYDHVNVSRNPTVPPPPPSSRTATCVPSTSLQPLILGHPPHMEHETDKSTETQQMSVDMLVRSGTKPAWRNDFQQDIVSEDGIECSSHQTVQNEISMRHADAPICSFAASGNCRYGERCHYTHGDLCGTCKKMCLHPNRPDEREKHIKLCKSLKDSREMNCGICRGSVLSKPPRGNKFGILPECDHCFCFECIKNWRGSDLDTNSQAKTCPVCRKLSYYVIPSRLWYFSKEEKYDIIESYKSKLKSTDCKLFNFGTGFCPYKTNCFYKHAYTDGRLEDTA